MAERNRMPPWHERLRLRNGREVQIRPIRPEDAEPLRAGLTIIGNPIRSPRAATSAAAPSSRNMSCGNAASRGRASPACAISGPATALLNARRHAPGSEPT